MLENIQAKFELALLKEDVNLNFICSQNKENRVEIYRHTVRENLMKALSLTYPGIWRLLGETCANQVASLFCNDKANLPISGCLEDWGQSFPAFLSAVPELKALCYLEDFANYEWHKQLAFVAKESSFIAISQLKSFSENQLVNLKFEFNPCVILFRSRYPLDKIMELLSSHDITYQINLDKRAACALITRLERKVVTFWLSGMDWYFIKQLKSGKKLINALNKTLRKYPDFDLTKALHFMLEKKIIGKI
ncbi:MAG: putative DNA-binding domain-containing protein [Proteobacteria bacterium]|nr:putative DNA-binding domain-containing protein [Pseudomonadota bacterium]